MSNSTSTILICILIIAFIVLAYVWYSKNAKIDELETTIAKLTNEVKTKKEEIEQLEKSGAGSKEALEKLNKEFQALQLQLNNYAGLVSSVKAILDTDRNINTTGMVTNISKIQDVAQIIIKALTDYQRQIQTLIASFNQGNNNISPDQRAALVYLVDSYNGSFTAMRADIDRLTAENREMLLRTANYNQLQNELNQRTQQRDELLLTNNEMNVRMSNYNQLQNELTERTQQRDRILSVVDSIKIALDRLVARTTLTAQDSLLAPTGSAIDINNLQSFDALLNYISTTRGVLNKILEISSRKNGTLDIVPNRPTELNNAAQLVDLMEKYNNQIISLQNEVSTLRARYTKVGSRVPIRFLRNSYLFGMDANTERPKLLDGMDWTLPNVTNAATDAPELCETKDFCASFTFPGSNLVPIGTVNSRSVHERDANNSYPICPAGSRVSKVLSARVSAQRDASNFKNLVSEGHPINRLLGQSNIRVNQLINGDPMVGTEKNYNFDVLCAPDTSVYYNAGYFDGQQWKLSSLFKNTETDINKSYNVMISKPELIDWSNYNFDPATNTIDFSRLNDGNVGSRGILFRRTELMGESLNNDKQVKSFEECMNHLNNTNGLAAVMGRNTDPNGFFYCSPRGTAANPPTLVRNVHSVNSSLYDVYVKPGADVRFDF